MNLAPTGWPEPRRRPTGWDLPIGRRRTRLESWLRNDPLYVRAGSIPTLDLNFAEDRSLVDRISGRQLITFTRSSTATYIGPSGDIVTAAVNEPRFQHDPVTGRCLGLLTEEARTNLLINSNALSTQNVTVAAAAHTLHFTGTGTIVLSGASTAGPLVGTGDGESNRVSLTFTPTAGSLALTVSGTVNNAQLEVGAFRTSYIPTASVAATRATDAATITGANFTSWYNRNQGVTVGDCSISGASSFYGIYDYGSGGTQPRRWGSPGISSSFGGSGANTVGGLLYTGGRFADCYAGSDQLASSINGSVVDQKIQANLTTAGFQLLIMQLGGLNQTCGTLSRFTYWPVRLHNNILLALSRRS